MSPRAPRTPLADKWSYLKDQPAFQTAPVRTILRLASWRARCWLRMPATVRLPPWDVRLHLPAQWTGVAKLIYCFREKYEPELWCLRRLLSPGSVVVDAGASLGIYTLVSASLVGSEGRVLAFEPASESFGLLTRNIALNRLRNVRAFRSALADRAESRRLYHHADPGRSSLGAEAASEGDFEEIRADTLDTILAREQIRRVNLLKMDVEGAEELILRGADATLKEMLPAVLFEVNPKTARRLGLPADGAWKLLQRLGYEFFSVDAEGELRRITSYPEGGNVIALHARASSAIPGWMHPSS